MKHRSSRAFTIIELLVVVSIIALLVGILLPAIGKARDQANLTRSQANIKQVSTAAITYSTEWSDRQVTYVDDNLSRYGTSGVAALMGFGAALGPGAHHPYHYLGNDSDSVLWHFTFITDKYYVPYNFSSRFGTFRMTNSRPLNLYMSGRYYDPAYFAPKDSVVLDKVEPFYDHPGEFVNIDGNTLYYSSYCFSPAAMYNPAVFSYNKSGSNSYFTDPFQLPAGHRSPSMSQATFPTLKTHLLEHHWLQRRERVCNPVMMGGVYDCEPFYFNASPASTPVAAFYDGHVGPVSVEQAMTDDLRVNAQTQATQQHGLWSRNTPSAADGYFSEASFYDGAYKTSFHILTIDGIKGRDFVK